MMNDNNILFNQYKGLIEMTYAAFGIAVKVVDVIDMNKYVQVRMEIAMGTSIDDILKYEKDIALAVSSPTGKVKIIAPIPGTCLVGINVPKKTIIK